MPAGDAQRVWFAEMVERLRAEWREGVSIEALIALRNELDGMLGAIRSGRHIRTPVITCRKCGHTGHEPPPHVSVRAVILALERFGIAAPAQTRALEKVWARYRQQHGRDLYGNALEPKPDRPSECTHLDVA